MPAKFTSNVVLAIYLAIAVSGCRPLADPSPGLARYRSQWVEEVAGYSVDLAGGNGRYRIEAFRNGVDTRLGAYGFAFTYNSATASWMSEFAMRYDGLVLIDDTGARYAMAHLADGSEVPGSHWRRLSASAIRSRGGRHYEFDAASGELLRIGRGLPDSPELLITSDRVQQCRGVGQCEDLFLVARDAQGRIVAITSRGRAAELGWNDEGQIASFRQSGDVQAGRAGFRFEYGQGLLTAVTNPADERIEIAYQGRRVREIKQVGEGDPRHRFVYGTTWLSGSRTRATLLTDPRGGQRTVAHDDALRVLADRNQMGEVTRWTWSGLTIASRTEPHGAVWSWHRSGPGGDTLTETQPSGNAVVTRYQLDAQNPVDHREYAPLLREDSVGVIETRSYDADGRLSAISDAEGYREEFLYGAWSELAAVYTHAEIDPHGTTFGGYGWHGHPTSVGLYNPVATVYRDRVYNAAGDLVNGDDLSPEAPGQPGVLEQDYDENRFLSQKQLDFGSPASVVIHNRFDGQISSVVRPYGGDTIFGYDALGRLTSRCMTVADTPRCSTIAYDASSNPVLLTRPDGSTEGRTYDAANREIAVHYTKPGAADMALVRSFLDGRVEWIEDSGYGMQRDSYQYGASGEIVQIDFHDGKRMEADRDARGRVAELRFLVPDGAGHRTALTLGWDYDGVDRPTHLYEDGLLLIRDTYASGRISERWTANGNTRDWIYASAWFGGQLEETSTVGPMISATSFIEREPGRLEVTTSVAGLPSGDVVDLIELHHSTDPLAQSELGAFVEGWGEDAVYGFAPELQYRYDALGNLESVSPSTGSVIPGSQVTWNAEHNRVISADYGGETIGFVYNDAGEVVERGGLPVTRNATGAVVGYGLWFAEKDARARFVSLAGTPRVFGGLMEADALGDPSALELPDLRIELAGPGNSNTHYYKHRDFRGNLQRVDDDAGRPVALYRYDAFGVVDRFGTLPDMPEHTFAGGVALGEGLVLTGRRVLDPACKCYWSDDPVFNSLSQVAYTANPLLLWDPTGEQAAPAGSGGSQGGPAGAGSGTTGTIIGGSAVVAAGATVVGQAMTVTGAVAIGGWVLGLALIGFGLYLIFFALFRI